MIKWNVPEKDLDGMKVYYREIDGMTGTIVDIFNDGLTAELKLSDNSHISIPTVQLQTMEKEFIVNDKFTHHCNNCDVRLYDSSEASIPVYNEKNECISVCRECTENDSIFFQCQYCGEYTQGEKCKNPHCDKPENNPN